MRLNRPFAVWLLSGAAIFGATELPSITPQVTSLIPHGGMRGSEVRVEFRGSYLDGATALRFTDSQIELHRLKVTSAGVQLYQRLASAVLFPEPAWRAPPAERKDHGGRSHALVGHASEPGLSIRLSAPCR